MPESTVELRRHIEHDESRDWCPPLDRRTALRLFAMSTLAAVTGCGGSTAATFSSATTSGTTTSTTTLSASKTTVEQGASLTVTASVAPTAATGAVTFHDGTSTQQGVPLTLNLYVFDSQNSCVPMQGVQVDIWHCNAQGVYSAEGSESTTADTWLRGYQITDATGKVQFTTIIPGWYQGRTTHIHLRFRSTYDETDSSGSNTMQVFFEQTLIDTLSTSVSPYSTEGQNSTTNAGDRVYTDQDRGTTLLTLSGSTEAGYAATFNTHLPIVSG